MNVTNEALRGAAFHEAGHVVVARALGLTVGTIEIGEDGSGKAEISSAEHLPLVDQIALCVAGISASIVRCSRQVRRVFRLRKLLRSWTV